MGTSNEWEAVTVSRCLRVVSEDKNPDKVYRAWLKRGGKKMAYAIRWTGGGYDGKHTWIKCDVDSVFDLKEMR